MVSQKKLNIAVIGAGKIAHSLTSALVKSGYNVSMVVSRNINSAKRLALKNNITKYSSNLKDIPAACNFYILSVPDNQIKLTADSLSKLKLNFRQSVFIHLSGALNVSALQSLKRNRAQVASLHIMQTFPSKKIISIKKCFAAVESGNRDTEIILFSIAEKLGLRAFKLKSKDKAFYHMAGVFASNFLVGLLFNAHKILERVKINDSDFFPMLEPIIFSTLNNIKNEGTSKALSGPVERGDLQTVKEHISALKLNLKKNKNDFYNYSIYLNYISQSLNLLEVVKDKKGNLTKEHLELKFFLLKELKSSRCLLNKISE